MTRLSSARMATPVCNVEGGLMRTRSQMALDIMSPRKVMSPTSVAALLLGAAAVGAIAIGALAIGQIAIGRLAIKKARIGALQVDELTVRRLRVTELQDEKS